MLADGQLYVGVTRALCSRSEQVQKGFIENALNLVKDERDAPALRVSHRDAHFHPTPKALSNLLRVGERLVNRGPKLVVQQHDHGLRADLAGAELRLRRLE